MTTMRIAAVATALGLCASGSPAHADWTGKGDVSASFATGNSENQSFAGGLELKNKLDKWQHTFGVLALTTLGLLYETK